MASCRTSSVITGSGGGGFRDGSEQWSGVMVVVVGAVQMSNVVVMAVGMEQWSDVVVVVVGRR